MQIGEQSLFEGVAVWLFLFFFYSSLLREESGWEWEDLHGEVVVMVEKGGKERG